MFPNYFEFHLTPRTADDKFYHLQLNQSALETLSFIFEFKFASAWQISRVIKHQDQNKYIYLRLKRIWQTGLLKSFAIPGSYIYYFLSKQGLKLLEHNNLYTPKQIAKYPKVKTILSTHYFPHESQIVELASLEAMNNRNGLTISFKGEATSQGEDYKSNYTIEAFTPDYTAYYTLPNQPTVPVFTEFERTQKSKAAMDKKLSRYSYFLGWKPQKNLIIRFIFQTTSMEESFWRHLFLEHYSMIQSYKIVTTNLSLLNDPKDFLAPVYVNYQTMQLIKPNRLEVDISRRVELFKDLQIL